MADHKRKQIRDAVVVTLGGLSTTGANVFPGLARALSSAQHPAIGILTDSETPEYMTFGGPRGINRELEITVVVCHKSATVLEDIIDQVAKEVEIAMAADLTLGGLLVDLLYNGFVLNREPAEKVAATADITFTGLYRTYEGDPTV